MKLLVVTSLKEYQKNVAKIFEQAGISVFSVSDTIGFKENSAPNLIDEWFGAGTDHFDSIFLFSFTEDANADHAIELIKEYNTVEDSQFPIRAFILPVEKSTY
ncbi:MAG: hypothetical protein Q8891_08825 [Bacteroidota bacterium]|jgi:hypothetical protein|nr:hypothetical protein [Bacteroidota bacterium]